MEFRDKDWILNDVLSEEYKNSNCQSFWSDFIKSLDLGIKVNYDKAFNGYNVYEITDEQKWMLTKIKYGI